MMWGMWQRYEKPNDLLGKDHSVGTLIQGDRVVIYYKLPGNVPGEPSLLFICALIWNYKDSFIMVAHLLITNV